jgi:ribosomal protein S27AE
MWARFRSWKNGLTPVLLVVALAMMEQVAEDSAAWYAGMALAGAMGLAYVIEEVVWNVRGGGRPCARCGHPIVMKSFRVRNACANCGDPL